MIRGAPPQSSSNPPPPAVRPRNSVPLKLTVLCISFYALLSLLSLSLHFLLYRFSFLLQQRHRAAPAASPPGLGSHTSGKVSGRAVSLSLPLSFFFLFSGLQPTDMARRKPLFTHRFRPFPAEPGRRESARHTQPFRFIFSHPAAAGLSASRSLLLTCRFPGVLDQNSQQPRPAQATLGQG